MNRAVLDLPDTAAPVWLTTKALAAYLGFEGKYAVDSAQRWIARNGIRKYYRSFHCVLVRRSDVDAAMSAGV